MKYIAILGRIPELSQAELRAQFGESVRRMGEALATFEAPAVGEAGAPEVGRLGGILKLGYLLEKAPLEFLSGLPEGKLTVGLSDYSKGATGRAVGHEAMKLKKILARHGRNVRILAGPEAALATATCHHNQLGEKPKHVELLKVGREWYAGMGVQNISAYARRDQARPARDAKVGMLPPKLAQILINLCGPLPQGARVLDPFCGTGVVLQEAILMGYRGYGTDLSERMVEFSRKNLEWALRQGNKIPSRTASARPVGLRPSASQGAVVTGERRLSSVVTCGRPLKELITLAQGDATSFLWEEPVDAVACETYLGPPMSQAPAEIKLKAVKQECREIIVGFLKNLSGQLRAGTPVVIAVPAWLRPDGHYSGLNLLDEIEGLGYNVEKHNNLGSNLLYFREGQVVAREIIELRKK